MQYYLNQEINEHLKYLIITWIFSYKESDNVFITSAHVLREINEKHWGKNCGYISRLSGEVKIKFCDENVVEVIQV